MVNDYDHFASKRQVEILSGDKRAHVCVEKPMMERILPDTLAGKALLVGCGTGEESSLLFNRGIADVTGIDSSAESIRIAQESYPEARFAVGDMHHLSFTDAEFDYVYSSLAIHYSTTPGEVLKEIYRVLKPGGKLLFSVGHPLRWATKDCTVEGTQIRVLGYSQDSNHPKLYGTYSSYTEHEHTFPSGEVLRFYTGSPSFYFNLLKESGFSIDEFEESKVSETCKDRDSYYFERFNEFPQFMAFSATKR